MTLLGKTETTQQSGDNSININAGGDVDISCNGLSYRDVRDIVDDMLRDRFNQLSHIAREEAQKAVHAFLERWLPELPRDKFYRFQEPKMQMFLHDVFSASFESDGDEDVEKILFYALKTNLGDASTQKNAVIRRAVQALPLLSQTHINYLSFLFYTRIVSFESNVYDIINRAREVFSLLYSDAFLESHFLSILQEAHCLRPVVSEGENIDFEVLFVRKYPHLLQDIYSETVCDVFKNDFLYVKDLFEDDCKTPCKILTTWTYSELENELKNRGMEQYSFKLFYLLKQDCQDIVWGEFLYTINPKLQHFAYVWNDKTLPYSSLELTAVGRAIALFNCKAKMKGFEDAESQSRKPK